MSNPEFHKLAQELKAKHGKVFILETYIDDDEGDKRRLILKKPDRLTRKAAEKIMTDKGTQDAIELYLRAMTVGGDDVEEVIKNDSAFFAAGECVAEIITITPGKLTVV